MLQLLQLYLNSGFDTFFANGNKLALLDLIFTNNPDSMTECSTRELEGVSDHKLVTNKFSLDKCEVHGNSLAEAADFVFLQGSALSWSVGFGGWIGLI